jgi:hypothetical protein
VLDVVLLVDGSGSICGQEMRESSPNSLQGCNNWDKMISFLLQFVDFLNVTPSGNHVGVILFATEATNEAELDRLANHNPARCTCNIDMLLSGTRVAQVCMTSLQQLSAIRMGVPIRLQG